MSKVVKFRYDPDKYIAATKNRRSPTPPDVLKVALTRAVREAITRMQNYQPHYVVAKDGKLQYDGSGDNQWFSDNAVVCDRLHFLRETHKAIQQMKRKGFYHHYSNVVSLNGATSSGNNSALEQETSVNITLNVPLSALALLSPRNQTPE